MVIAFGERMLNQVSPVARTAALETTNGFPRRFGHKVSLTRAESFPGVEFFSLRYQP